MELDDVTSQGKTGETHDVTTEHDSGCEGSDLEEIGKNLPLNSFLKLRVTCKNSKTKINSNCIFFATEIFNRKRSFGRPRYNYK